MLLLSAIIERPRPHRALARAFGEGWRGCKDGRNQVGQGSLQYTTVQGIVDPAGFSRSLPRDAGAIDEPFLTAPLGRNYRY
jgi:hypothetical protein